MFLLPSDVVIFDNRYSWVHAKVLDYHLEVVAPTLDQDTNSYTAMEIITEENEQTKL